MSNNTPPKELFLPEFDETIFASELNNFMLVLEPNQFVKNHIYISQEYYEELLAKEVAKYRLQIVAIQDKLIAKQDELIKVLKSKSKK